MNRGFVRHFFQCTDCAVHFTEMASGNAAKAVASKKQAVLWMWRAHNEVCLLTEGVLLFATNKIIAVVTAVVITTY